MKQVRFCQHCYETNRSNARFCKRCGSAFSQTITAFLAHADEDNTLVENMIKHLRPLEYQRLLSIRSQRDILPGTEWQTELNKDLRVAEIILVAISPDLFDSYYFTDAQMKYLLWRHENREGIVVPIILRATFWEDTPLSRIQALPRGGRPIQSWPHVDEALLSIAQEIRRVIQVVYFP